MQWFTKQQHHVKLLRAFLGIYANGTASYNIITDNSINSDSSCSSWDTSRKYKLYGMSNCTQMRLTELNSSMNTNYKSTCPWYIYLNYDEDRLPKTIAMAKCACSNCTSVSNNISENGRCEEVNSYSPVIRRKWCLDGHPQYYVTIETIPVGCTCKRNFIT